MLPDLEAFEPASTLSHSLEVGQFSHPVVGSRPHYSGCFASILNHMHQPIEGSFRERPDEMQ